MKGSFLERMVQALCTSPDDWILLQQATSSKQHSQSKAAKRKQRPSKKAVQAQAVQAVSVVPDDGSSNSAAAGTGHVGHHAQEQLEQYPAGGSGHETRVSFLGWCVQQGFEVTEAFLLLLVSADEPGLEIALQSAWDGSEVTRP